MPEATGTRYHPRRNCHRRKRSAGGVWSIESEGALRGDIRLCLTSHSLLRRSR